MISGADRALVASDQARSGLGPSGFDHGYGDLPDRIARILHPTRGLKRGIIETDEQGKGGRDKDSMLIPVSVGEIREVHAVLTAIQELMK